MFKEVLRISISLEPSDLPKMEKSLGDRFNRVAKKFGKGLVDVLKGGGILGAVSLLANKLLNPLKEVQEAMDKALHNADSLKDQAERFQTTPAELAKLQAFGKTKGLEPEQVNELIGKFQSAVAQAAADPTQNHSVSKFVGNKDTGQAFLTFLENLSKLAKSPNVKDQNDAIRVQQEIFGERQIGKSGNFLRADFEQLNKKFSGIKDEDLNKAAEAGSKLSEIQNTSGALRDLQDIVKKSQIITEKVVESLETQKDIALKRENDRIQNSERLISLQTQADTLIAFLENEGLGAVSDLTKKIEQVAGTLGIISRLRGLTGLLGKKKE